MSSHPRRSADTLPAYLDVNVNYFWRERTGVACRAIMFERFAEGARRATALASQEAQEQGHDFIGTEHLLLGLLALGEGPAHSVLTELDISLDDARRKVLERVHAHGGASAQSPPFTPLAKKVLERAVREAERRNAAVVGTEHLLLALAEVPDGGGARIVSELAGNLNVVREAVLAQMEPGAAAPAVSEQTKVTTTGRTLRRWANQTRVVLRPPPTADTSGGLDADADADADDEAVWSAPRCPACQAPLATEARYRAIEVPAGLKSEEFLAADDGEGDGDAGGDEGDVDVDPAITVRVVYCGQCGAALGIA